MHVFHPKFQQTYAFDGIVINGPISRQACKDAGAVRLYSHNGKDEACNHHQHGKVGGNYEYRWRLLI